MRRASRSKRKGGSRHYADSHEVPNLGHSAAETTRSETPNLDCSKAAEKNMPSGGKGIKHSDAKSGDDKKKGIGKVEDYIASILPKYCDDDAISLAGHIVNLVVKKDQDNLEEALVDYGDIDVVPFIVEVLEHGVLLERTKAL